jgi:hypothetical protein
VLPLWTCEREAATCCTQPSQPPTALHLVLARGVVCTPSPCAGTVVFVCVFPSRLLTSVVDVGVLGVCGGVCASLQTYRQGQLAAIRGMQAQTEKAVAVAVDKRLKAAEESEARELRAAADAVQALARPPMHAVKCFDERAACVECYRQFGATEPLRCADQVRALESCALGVSRGLLWKGTKLE